MQSVSTRVARLERQIASKLDTNGRGGVTAIIAHRPGHPWPPETAGQRAAYEAALAEARRKAGASAVARLTWPPEGEGGEQHGWC